MITDFPNFIPAPFNAPPVSARARKYAASQIPFALIAERKLTTMPPTRAGPCLGESISPTGAFPPLPVFPNIPNPLFPGLGFATMEPVATGIASDSGQLLVALFGGFPFSAGASSIQQVDPVSGSATPFISGRKSPIGIIPFREHGETSYLVLQHASAGPFFASPGVVLRFDDLAASPSTVANCLTRPTSMSLNEKSQTLYVTEFGGRLVSVPFAP